MKVTRVKINGMENPLGYGFRKVKVSWNVEEFTGKFQKEAKIEISRNADFSEIVYTNAGDLKQYCEILEMALLPRTQYFVRVTVVADNGDVAVCDTAVFETGKRDEAWDAAWICTDKADALHPIFFKDFAAKTDVIRARIYVCGLGVYEAYVNGEKVGDEYLAPFYNDYDVEVQYQTYDITDMVKDNNCIELSVGNGWYKGRFGLANQDKLYGSYMTAIAEIHLDYADGSKDVIKTDNTWKYKGSDVEDSSIYDGEIYNRLLWEEGNPVKDVLLTDAAYPEDQSKRHLVERFSVPVRVCEILKVKEIIHTPAGETVLDFGQNFTGYVAFNANLPKGTKVTLEHGEVLQQGNFYNDNYRGALSQLVYVSNGETEYVHPHFTFYGGRFVRVTGWPQTMTLCADDFTGCVVHSDLEQTGYLETSDKDINQLISNCLWGQRSNFLDVPTDCPQRNERLGWTGDAQVFSPTASYNMDTRAFFDKYLHDLRVSQNILGGAVPHVSPLSGMIDGGSSVWGDVATFLPITMYEYFGDVEVIENYYPLMKGWVDYITKKDEAQGTHHLFDFGFHFGDWLALDGMTDQSVKGGTDDYYIASCYYYASTRKVAEAAKLIGNEADARKYDELADLIKEAILNEYFSSTGRLCIDTQTGYMVALKFGIWRDKERLIAGLRARFDKDGHKIKGGFVGATMMCRVLAENGFENEAWHMLFNHDFPGWLHCIDLGATTIWERWNSVLDDGSISGTGMNSLNHYAYGSVLEYIYRDIAGIAPTAPGFKSVTFAPQMNWRMKFMNCTYKSASGTYVSNWKLNDDGSVSVHFEVPFNCTAKAVLPQYYGPELNLEAGSHDIKYTPAKDIRQMFTLDSRMAEFAQSEEAMAILAEKLPMAAGMIKSGDVESLNHSLNEVKNNPFLGIPAELIDDVADEICKIISK